MTMTAVMGHLMGLDFPKEYAGWHNQPPNELFEAPVEKQVNKNMLDVAQNIEMESRYAQLLIIWTDCDREGENIGGEIVEICKRRNPSIRVKRAKFSVVQKREIMKAINELKDLDWKQVEAVDTRIELDLRVGAALTRFQTIRFQLNFPEQLGQKIISYGPCQFPSLGFVVEQYWKRENFIVEDFWGIHLSHQKDGHSVSFSWDRYHLFDRLCCFVIYEKVIEAKKARVISVDSKNTRHYKPHPLTTIELQKFCSSFLKINSHKTMQIAEELYNQGFISYPRTETDQFEKGFNLKELIEKQTDSNQWGQFAQNLLDGGFKQPRNGRHNDKAHPPIHPTKLKLEFSSNEHKKIYEFITRRFLACCSEDAIGVSQTVVVEMGGERFSAGGVQVLERNFLDVYIYEKWNTNLLPEYKLNETFTPTSCQMTSGKTTPPSLLTEAQLIATMDKNGIGTDATIAEHILKIKEREYVFVNNGYFIPSTLGLALVEGYDAIGFETSLAKPHLRAQMEQNMLEICQNTKTKQQVIEIVIRMYKEMYNKTQEQFDKLLSTLEKYIGPSQSQALPALQQRQPSLLVEEGNENHPFCDCQQKSVLKISKTERNFNKKFYSCSEKKCGFFQWLEPFSDNPSQTSQSNSSGQQQYQCFKCGQMGHLANQCTNSNSSSSYSNNSNRSNNKSSNHPKEKRKQTISSRGRKKSKK